MAQDQLAQKLADRAEIETIITLYARAIDRLDRELLLSLYHDDARDNHGGFIGTATQFADYALPFLRENFSATMHHITHITVELKGNRAATESYYYAWHLMDGDREKVKSFFGEPYAAKCESDGTLAQGHDFTCAGRYIDIFEKRDGTWKIADREITVEWKRFGPATTGSAASGIEAISAPPGRDRNDIAWRNLTKL
jgi:hypothetical protein